MKLNINVNNVESTKDIGNEKENGYQMEIIMNIRIKMK